jgi:hypothetical protein
MATRRETAAGVPLELIDFLLSCDRPNAAVDKLHAKGIEYDAFLTFDYDRMSTVDFQHLWKCYEPLLRREADRRGWQLPDPTLYRPFPTGVWVIRRWDGDE